MKEVKAWECEFCHHVTPGSESGAKQHEDMCRWRRAGHAVWVESGEVKHAERVPEALFGPHVYAEDGTSNCFNRCGCWAGPVRSGGPVDPFGPCPRNPKTTQTTGKDTGNE